MASERDPKDQPYSAPPGGGGPERVEPSLRTRIEAMVPEIVKKMAVSGIGALSMTEETLRSAPKDAVGYLVQRADSTRDLLFAAIAKEFREVLEQADLGEELAKALSHLSVEIRTEVIFKPKSDLMARNRSERPKLGGFLKKKRQREETSEEEEES
jgi:hypothetical protein